MFKLIFFLCACLYAAMIFGGANHGQQRFGLMAQPSAPATLAARVPQVSPVVAESAAPPAAPVVANLTEAAFVPEAPLMAATPAVATTTSAAEPEATSGVLMVVNTKSANVRSGPGQDFDVVGRLARGESVLVVAQDEGADGWSLIRIEGDGIEGYIASRLLTE